MYNFVWIYEIVSWNLGTMPFVQVQRYHYQFVQR